MDGDRGIESPGRFPALALRHEDRGFHYSVPAIKQRAAAGHRPEQRPGKKQESRDPGALMPAVGLESSHRRFLTVRVLVSATMMLSATTKKGERFPLPLLKKLQKFLP
jgi:hypothetical protein